MTDGLEQGRSAYERRSWAEAHQLLSFADGAIQLQPEDLERLATSVYLIGRDEECLKILDRAQHAYVERHQATRAARCAFWLGMHPASSQRDGSRNGVAGARRTSDRA